MGSQHHNIERAIDYSLVLGTMIPSGLRFQSIHSLSFLRSDRRRQVYKELFYSFITEHVVHHSRHEYNLELVSLLRYGDGHFDGSPLISNITTMYFSVFFLY